MTSLLCSSIIYGAKNGFLPIPNPVVKNHAAVVRIKGDVSASPKEPNSPLTRNAVFGLAYTSILCLPNIANFLVLC